MAVYKKFGEVEQAIAFEWQADADGNAEVDGGWIEGGTVSAFVNIPGAGVTDDFDVSVSALMQLDRDGNRREFLDDVLSGGGANISNTSETKNLSTVGYLPFQSKLTLHVANAGAGTNGVFILCIWKESQR